MQTPLVMTIIGPDRTGLVESVARVVADHGGNWLESRMSRLGGEFAGILFLIGFAALFAWQVGGFVRRNRPQAYSFDHLPEALLP